MVGLVEPGFRHFSIYFLCPLTFGDGDFLFKLNLLWIVLNRCGGFLYSMVYLCSGGFSYAVTETLMPFTEAEGVVHGTGT
jgi:hypothetical protein